MRRGSPPTLAENLLVKPDFKISQLLVAPERIEMRFFKGQKFSCLRICVQCASEFPSASGYKKWCDKCRGERRICPECQGQKSEYDLFCGNSCAGIWKYRSNVRVRDGLAAGVSHPNRAKGISRARLGRPRHDMRGSLNHAWRGGTYGTVRHRLMGRVEYINWRREVFHRDDFRCKACGKRGGRLQAHHIVPYAQRPDLALELENGQTLCVPCHRMTPTWGHGAKLYIEAKFQRLSAKGK